MEREGLHLSDEAGFHQLAELEHRRIEAELVVDGEQAPSRAPPARRRCRAPCRLRARGFSRSRWRPARTTRTASSAWVWSGVQRLMTRMLSSARTSSEGAAGPDPNLLPAALQDLRGVQALQITHASLVEGAADPSQAFRHQVADRGQRPRGGFPDSRRSGRARSPARPPPPSARQDPGRTAASVEGAHWRPLRRPPLQPCRKQAASPLSSRARRRPLGPAGRPSEPATPGLAPRGPGTSPARPPPRRTARRLAGRRLGADGGTAAGSCPTGSATSACPPGCAPAPGRDERLLLPGGRRGCPAPDRWPGSRPGGGCARGSRPAWCRGKRRSRGSNQKPSLPKSIRSEKRAKNSRASAVRRASSP